MPFYSFQNIGADLAVRVSSLFQLHNALSMENKQLRMQISSLQHAKLIKDGMSEKSCALFLVIRATLEYNLDYESLLIPCGSLIICSYAYAARQ